MIMTLTKFHTPEHKDEYLLVIGILSQVIPKDADAKETAKLLKKLIKKLNKIK